MEFLDPFGTGNGSAVPSPAKKPSGMNYGGAQARMRAQSGNVGSTNQAGGQLGAYGSGNGTGAKRNNTKPSTVGLGALSMLDPLAQQQGGLPVRPQSESVRNDLCFAQNVHLTLLWLRLQSCRQQGGLLVCTSNLGIFCTLCTFASLLPFLNNKSPSHG